MELTGNGNKHKNYVVSVIVMSFLILNDKPKSKPTQAVDKPRVASHVEGDFNASDIILPYMSIGQKSGTLCDEKVRTTGSAAVAAAPPSAAGAGATGWQPAASSATNTNPRAIHLVCTRMFDPPVV